MGRRGGWGWKKGGHTAFLGRASSASPSCPAHLRGQNGVLKGRCLGGVGHSAADVSDFTAMRQESKIGNYEMTRMISALSHLFETVINQHPLNLAVQRVYHARKSNLKQFTSDQAFGKDGSFGHD